MYKKHFTLFIAMTCFGFGYAFHTLVQNKVINDQPMKRVTGIGGIFFKCKDPKQLREWYQKHLGLEKRLYPMEPI
jgi:hypothetical protein